MKAKSIRYAHNAAYCMIRPDAREDEDVVSTSESGPPRPFHTRLQPAAQRAAQGAVHFADSF